MQITSGSVQGRSSHYFEHDEQRLSLRAQTATTAPPSTTPSATIPAAELPLTMVRIEVPDFDPDDPSALYAGRIGLLKALVEAFIGHDIDTLGATPQAADGGQASSGQTAPPPPAAAAPAQRVVRTASIDVVRVHESELTEVAFQGQFATADGHMIAVDLHYRLEREYAATTVNAAAGATALRDPLILNFDGRGVQLDPQQTNFDLDSDGEAEAIATLAAGSAYLALDGDGNGTIDRGNELFGPSTNNGFAELARWDSDGNGFIDSGDPVFAQLRLFRPGAALQTLAERDVGAIFLGAVASAARLTDTGNQSLGQLRATSFYLTNSGSAGLAQELDLAV